ncbi:MAG: GDYXXLXY domain-containing protein [Hyphomicrobiaceae bacterium]
MPLDKSAEHGGLPDTIAERAALAAIVAAGALIGFGVVLWVAAHWLAIGTTGRFVLVGIVTLAAGMVAARSDRARPAAALVGILGTGGLLALYGQTFQTGADPWQLFALWAALAVPWALAARSDAVWVLVVMVAATALGLWLAANLAGPGGSRPTRGADVPVVLAGWAMAVLIALLLFPEFGLGRWLGKTRWAFRLAAVAAVPLVATYAMPDVGGRGGSSLLEVGGIVVLGGSLAALAMARRFDLALCAVLVLGIDAVLMAHAAHALLPARGDLGTGSLLAIGIAWAAIFALSAAGLMALARKRNALPAALAGRRGDDTGHAWPVTVLTGLGAIFTALPFLGVVGLLFSGLLTNSAGFLVLGLPILAAAVAVAWAGGRSLFVQQLAFIGVVVGLSLVTVALIRDLGASGGSLALLALVSGLAMLMRNATAALLGACAALFAAMLVLDSVQAVFLHGRIAWTILLVVAAAAMLGLAAAKDRAVVARHQIDAWLGGWTTISLAAAVWSSGPTFLGGGVGGQSIGRAGSALWTASLPVTLTVTPLRVAAVVVTGAALALVWRRWPALSSRTAVAVGATVLVASFLMPTLAGPFAVLAAALVSGRRITAIGAVIAALWIGGTYYYWFGLPLTTKAAILVALGLGIAVAVWLDGGDVMEDGSGAALGREAADGRTALVAAGLAATVAVLGLMTGERREVVATGREMLVELAPVDPRSLIQGDYMALNFRLPQVRPEDDGAMARKDTLVAMATIDARGVATVRRIVVTKHDRRPDEHPVLLSRKGGRLILGTDAYHFPEGTAERYASARFGRFRLAPDGRAVLIGLADRDLKPIE